jgi:Domain of unknown function (DUF4189)
MRLRGFIAAGVVAAAASLAASEAAAQNNFGAIAYSPGTGAHGWANNHSSREAAEAAALQNCRQHAGDCTVPIWFRNACGALAVGTAGYGSGWGTSRQLAENYALQVCRKFTGNCGIRRWVCTAR